MRKARHNRLLTGTAVAVVLPLALAFPASAQDANAPTAGEVETTVPTPQSLGSVQPKFSEAETVVAAPKPPGPAPLSINEVETAVTAGADLSAAWTKIAVSDRLRELGSGTFDRLIGSRRERADINTFYQTRDYAPLWVGADGLNARGQAAAGYLAGVAADGLEPADYPTPAIAPDADAAALAEAEIRLTRSILDFARHAQTGRVHYTRVSADISYDLDAPKPAEVLAKLAEADDVAVALDSFNPPAPGYKRLKAALAKARATPDEKPEVVQIAAGRILRPGMEDPRVLDVRKRLGITDDTMSPVYDEAVFQAVKAFQREKGLYVDGMLGPNTLRAMNGKHGPSADPIETIIANMERWRWMPRDLGKIHVMVNTPDFTLQVVRGDKVVWSTKIVVGKPSLKTPLMTAAMKYITVNPTWNVPPSIIRNEYLPAIQQDPTALDRAGLKMEQNRDGTIRIYQPPGDRNALGRIRFNFPNKFLVYQHDTPERHLFKRDVRAYSHGCMRVQNPIKYGEVLLSLAMPGKGYSQARLRSMFGPSEININLPKPIPVHLTYQTAFVDEDGELQFRNDIYGFDRTVLAWLDDGQRKIAHIAMARPKSTSAQPVRMPADLMASRGMPRRGYGFNGPSFFDQLFGFAPAEPVHRPPRRYRRHFSFGGPPGF